MVEWVIVAKALDMVVVQAVVVVQIIWVLLVVEEQLLDKEMLVGEVVIEKEQEVVRDLLVEAAVQVDIQEMEEKVVIMES